MHNPYKDAVTQLELVARRLESEYSDKQRFRAAIQLLTTPERLHEGSLEITLDSGKQQSGDQLDDGIHVARHHPQRKHHQDHAENDPPTP